MYKDFIIIFTIIIIHEFGHFLISKLFKWNLDKISIYPFGGCVKFNEKLNKPLIQELFILLGGPSIQIIFFGIVFYLHNKGFITYRNYLIFKQYNYTLLWFNLLPIYPLDGGRILNIINNYFLPFKLSNRLSIILSYIFIFYVFIIERNVNLTSMLLLLGCEDYLYLIRQDYLYNKLLLERYIENFNFKKMMIIKNKNNFYKDKRHVIKINNKYITEKEYLNERFGD